MLDHLQQALADAARLSACQPMQRSPSSASTARPCTADHARCSVCGDAVCHLTARHQEREISDRWRSKNSSRRLSRTRQRWRSATLACASNVRPPRLLGGYRGILLCDGYRVYKQLAEAAGHDASIKLALLEPSASGVLRSQRPARRSLRRRCRVLRRSIRSRRRPRHECRAEACRA